MAVVDTGSIDATIDVDLTMAAIFFFFFKTSGRNESVEAAIWLMQAYLLRKTWND